MGQVKKAPPPPPPPLEEDDLYEPPPHYQPPPPPAAATTNSNEKVQNFPPPPPPHPHPQHLQQIPNPNPNQSYFPAQPQGIPSPLIMNEQPWNTHLFGCMANPLNAVITLFFPCVTFGQIAEVLDNGTTSCATNGMWYSVIACCIAMPCLMSCGYRSKLRAKYNLVESPAPDCLIHCFCECCALCQEYRELQERGCDPAIGHSGNVAKQQRQQLQMQQQFGVTPPMQQRMMM